MALGCFFIIIKSLLVFENLFKKHCAISDQKIMELASALSCAFLHRSAFISTELILFQAKKTLGYAAHNS